MKALKKKWETAALLAGMLTALPAGASGRGVGKEGSGGEIVRQGGVAYVRDLVDNAVCKKFVPASRVAATLPEMERILGSLERSHWLLAGLYRNELRNMAVCFLGAPLKQVPTEDQDAVAMATVRGEKLAAVRIDDTVYVDMNEYKTLSPEMRAVLLFHEATHAFIPKDTKRRNFKVKSFVNMIYSSVDSPLSQEELALGMKQLSIQAPVDTAAADPVRSEAEAMLAATGPNPEACGAASRIAARRESSPPFVGLSAKAVDRLEAFSKSCWERFYAAIGQGKLEELQAFAREGVNLLEPDFYVIRSGDYLESTPYRVAIHSGQREVVRYLKSVNPSHRSLNEGWYLMDDLIREKKWEDARVVLATASGVNSYGHWNLIKLALKNGGAGLVPDLLKRREISISTEDFFATLARKEGDLFRALLDDPRTPVNGHFNEDNVSGGPVIHAIHRNDLEKLAILLRHPRVDVNEKYNSIFGFGGQNGRRTPMLVAIHEGKVEAVRMLVASPRVDLAGYETQGLVGAYEKSQQGHLEAAAKRVRELEGELARISPNDHWQRAEAEKRLEAAREIHRLIDEAIRKWNDQNHSRK